VVADIAELQLVVARVLHVVVMATTAARRPQEALITEGVQEKDQEEGQEGEGVEM
jgi:hypothetical protein